MSKEQNVITEIKAKNEIDKLLKEYIVKLLDAPVNADEDISESWNKIAAIIREFTFEFFEKATIMSRDPNPKKFELMVIR